MHNIFNYRSVSVSGYLGDLHVSSDLVESQSRFEDNPPHFVTHTLNVRLSSRDGSNSGSFTFNISPTLLAELYELVNNNKTDEFLSYVVNYAKDVSNERLDLTLS